MVKENEYVRRKLDNVNNIKAVSKILKKGEETMTPFRTVSQKLSALRVKHPYSHTVKMIIYLKPTDTGRLKIKTRPPKELTWGNFRF